MGVSPGLAYAPAVVLDWKFPAVADRWVSEAEVEGEVRRLHAAVAAVVKSLERLRERVLERAGLEESQIFEAQIMMVQDPDFLAEVERLIRDNRFSAPRPPTSSRRWRCAPAGAAPATPGCASGSPICSPPRSGCCGI